MSRAPSLIAFNWYTASVCRIFVGLCLSQKAAADCWKLYLSHRTRSEDPKLGELVGKKGVGVECGGRPDRL